MTKTRPIVREFAVKSNAKVNSRQTYGEGDVKVSCRKIHCHNSRQKRRSVKALDVQSNSKAISKQTSDGGDVKVCRRENTVISIHKIKAQREGVCCEKQCEGKLKTHISCQI